MGGKVREKSAEARSGAQLDVVVDPNVDWQNVGAGVQLFWWTKDDGTREGMLCETELCAIPICPLRDATIHAVRVGPDLARIWLDAAGVFHAESNSGPLDLNQEPRAAAIRVIFERRERRVGPADGDPELVKRLYEVFDEERLAVVERFWEGQRLSDPATRQMVEPGRNAPCPCGSGKKYKRCCMNRAMKAQRLPNGMVSLAMRMPDLDDGRRRSVN
jgi:hypothetical protein